MTMKKTITMLALMLIMAVAGAQNLDHCEWRTLEASIAQVEGADWDEALWDSLQTEANSEHNLMEAIRLYGEAKHGLGGHALNRYEREVFRVYFWARREQLGKEAGRWE